MGRESQSLNTLEAAAFLGVHPQTVRKLARTGELPSFKVGKDWRFRREALLRWVEAQGRRPARTILVVDDELPTCRMLQRIVEGLGYRARCCADGVEGLRAVADEAPAMILLDLLMPQMTGPQFLAELRKTHPDIPVAIVTGHPDGALMRQASLHAPIMLLPKPVAPELVERTIRSVLAPELQTSP